MDALIKNEYSEYIPEPMDYKKTVWYIPHHGVQQPNKLRVVFDCSAQYTRRIVERTFDDRTGHDKCTGWCLVQIPDGKGSLHV